MAFNSNVPTALAALLLTAAAVAQTVTVPRSGPPANSVDPGMRAFGPLQLKDRPYNGSLPKPPFPSTERVQRAFTVAYVYDYAYSAYTPTVTLPIQPVLAAKRDTPEAAVLALLSAMRTGNFDAFVDCWDDADKPILLALKKQPAELQQLLNGWKTIFGGNRPVELLDRVELIGYVLLDVRAGTAQLPSVFKLENGQWRMTNDLGRSGDLFLGNWKPDVAGNVTHVQPVPASSLDSPATKLVGRAQAEFLKQHNLRSSLVESAQ